MACLVSRVLEQNIMSAFVWNDSVKETRFVISNVRVFGYFVARDCNMNRSLGWNREHLHFRTQLVMILQKKINVLRFQRVAIFGNYTKVLLILPYWSNKIHFIDCFFLVEVRFGVDLLFICFFRFFNWVSNLFQLLWSFFDVNQSSRVAQIK